RATAPLNRESGPNPYVVHEKLRDVSTRYVGIWRDEEGLTQGIEEIRALRREAEQVKAYGSSQYNPGWSEALDLNSLLTAAEAVARSALIRQESRGAHSRVDYQGERDEWKRYNVFIYKGPDGDMVVEKRERPEDPPELAKIAYASLEELEGSNG